MEKHRVGIVLGSDSDFPVMEEAARILRNFGVPYEMTIASAHRSPDLASEYARSAEERGIEVIIAAAGMAAHLPGVLAAYTCLPVIGVPLKRRCPQWPGFPLFHSSDAARCSCGYSGY